jgi:acetate kinase
MNPANSNILTINGGSSSIRFALYDITNNLQNIFLGKIDRVGMDNSQMTVTFDNSNEKKNLDIANIHNFKDAADFLIRWLEKQEGFNEVRCIGHRIVYGIQHSGPEIIDGDLLEELQQITEYDMDHLPAEIEMIKLFKKHYPSLLQVACFDTSFHITMPRLAKILPIPRRFDEAGIHRYGFHGLSYSYLMEELKNKTGNNLVNEKIILAHLGNGASLAAGKEGKSMDTSMGFTPTGGIMMGTRCGDIDPGVAWYIMQSEKMSVSQFNKLINHESGLLGVSEISSDMQELLAKEDSDIRAAETIGLFCYQAKKWIGAFTAALSGLDTLVFSGGIGENAPIVRSRICEGLQYIGIELDEVQNKNSAFQISTANSKVNVYVIPTNEELMIAKITAGIYNELEIINN